MLSVIEEHRPQLAEICARYGVRRLDLFGSAARGEFDPASSDLDFVVEFRDWKPEGAADRYLGLLTDLEELFHRKVDVVFYGSIRNPYFKQVVDRTRVQLYAA